MKNIWKIAAVLVILGILGAAYGWFFVYNKSHVDYEKASPDFRMSAAKCYEVFSNSAGAESIYSDKILEITGEPAAIENMDSLVIVVFTFGEGMFGDEGIRCTMLPNHQKKALLLETGEAVTIKGYCPGYNGTDVILQYCSIIN